VVDFVGIPVFVSVHGLGRVEYGGQSQKGSLAQMKGPLVVLYPWSCISLR